jgi:hypothetical protein
MAPSRAAADKKKPEQKGNSATQTIKTGQKKRSTAATMMMILRQLGDIKNR